MPVRQKARFGTQQQLVMLLRTILLVGAIAGVAGSASGVIPKHDAEDRAATGIR